MHRKEQIEIMIHKKIEEEYEHESGNFKTYYRKERLGPRNTKWYIGYIANHALAAPAEIQVNRKELSEALGGNLDESAWMFNKIWGKK